MKQTKNCASRLFIYIFYITVRDFSLLRSARNSARNYSNDIALRKPGEKITQTRENMNVLNGACPTAIKIHYTGRGNRQP